MPRNGRWPAVCGVVLAALVAMAPASLAAQATQQKRPANSSELCLDGFCIGQSIEDARFETAEWIVPHDSFTKESCNGVGCAPQVAFRGYPTAYQKPLAEALSWVYGLGRYSIITKDNLDVLRHYKYECNPSARGIFGERRFFGAYKSIPSHYLTVVGLRLIDGELRVYRIARQYPYHTQAEIVSLARRLRDQYGDTLCSTII